MATIEDGRLNIYNLPLHQSKKGYRAKPVHNIDLGEKIKFHQVRWLPFGSFNMLAVTDFLSNVFLFKDGRLFKTYLNAHAKLITDLCWFFTYDHDEQEPVPYFATSSMDGALKLWSLTDQFVPLFDHFTSKASIFSMLII